MALRTDPAAASGARPRRSGLLWILLGALAVRLLALALTHGTPLAGDELDYFWRGAERAQGLEPRDLGFRPPLMEFLYAGIFEIFGVSVTAARLVTIGMSVATLIPLHRLGCRLGGSRTGLLAAGIAAVYPNFVAFSHYLWSETAYTLLVVTGIELVCSYTERRSLWKLGAAGLVFGLSALARVVGAAFPLLAAVWLVWHFRERGVRALVGPAWLVAALVLTILPWTLHLNRPGDPFALLTRTTYLYLYIGNGETVNGVAPVNRYEGLGATRIEREARARELAFEAIRKRLPWWPLEKLASELPDFFTPSSFAVRRLSMPPDHAWRLNRPWSYHLAWEDTEGPRGGFQPGPRVALVVGIVAVYIVVALLGAGGLCLLPDSTIKQLLLLFLLAQIGPTLVTFAVSRFRLASMAVLILSAAWLLGRGLDAWREAGRARRLAAVASVLLLAGMIALRWDQLYGNTWA